MSLEKDIKELKKHIKYIEMVLKEKKDELFCLLVEKKQKDKDNKKGA
jgi:vacuolar-type H+-ATPase subunit D/Vma8|tara:strand:+ start:3361 stop:3501 length:141 start_codon:yes stop_codon:yes gene_type:complete